MARLAESGARTRYRGPYADAINRAAMRYRIDPFLLAALLKVESGFNPKARSSAGAVGIAQFMPATAAGMGIDPWKPGQAIPGAARYLRNGIDQAGSVAGALRRYNTGSSAASGAGTAYVDQVQAAYRDLRGGGSIHQAGDPRAQARAWAAAVRKWLARVRIIGHPYQGTHTLGNWQSDNAIDIALPTGTPIYAPASGTIGSRIGLLTESGSSRFAGQRLTLETKGNAFYFAHLSRLAVRAGQRVKQGQLLGYSGSANGVEHLHLGQEKGTPNESSWKRQAAEWLAVGALPGVGAPALLAGGIGKVTGIDVPGVGGLLGGAGDVLDATKATGQVAVRFLEDPAYPLLWVLLLVLGLALMLLGILRMTGQSPTQLAMLAGTRGMSGAGAAGGAAKLGAAAA